MRNFRRVLLALVVFFGVFGMAQTSQAWWHHRHCGGWSRCCWHRCYTPCCYTPCCYVPTCYTPCCYGYSYSFPTYATVAPVSYTSTYAAVARKPAIATTAVSLAQRAVSPTGSSAAYRTWIDATGRYSIQAKFVQMNGDMVRLKKDNGDVIEIAMSKLSDTDQFVAQQFGNSEIKIASAARSF